MKNVRIKEGSNKGYTVSRRSFSIVMEVVASSVIFQH